MDLQNKVVKKFLNCFKDGPSCVELAEVLNINDTRVFRILRGSPMKLFEYERFVEFILANDATKEERSPQLSILLDLFEHVFCQYTRSHIEHEILREIKLKNVFEKDF